MFGENVFKGKIKLAPQQVHNCRHLQTDKDNSGFQEKMRIFRKLVFPIMILTAYPYLNILQF